MWHETTREFREEEEEEEEEEEREGRILQEDPGGEVGLMRCKLVPICSNADSWSVTLTGDTVSPTSPNKHFSVLPPKQMPSPRQDALHAAGLPQVTWCHSWKWESCAMRSLMHACWTSLFVHLVKQYPHNHHRCHLIPTHTHLGWIAK